MHRITIALLLFICLLNTSPCIHAEPNRSIDTQLLDACRGHDLALVRSLLLKGANVNVLEDTTKCTPLLLAADQKDNQSIIELLVRSGAKVEDHSGYNGATPLMSAASKGNISNIDSLLKLGANLETRDNDGQTALIHSIGNSAAFHYLLDHHANFKTTENDGSQPIHWAAGLGNLECVVCLVELGVDLNTRNKDNITPAGEQSLSRSRFAVMAYLIANGADINLVDYQGPVWMAYLGDTPMLTLLLDHGANLQARTRDGWTGLHVAASSNDAETVQMLIAHGADINAKTRKGETAYALAAKRPDNDYERDDIVAILIKAGERDAKPIPKKPDILLSPDSDAVAVIRALNSGGSINGKEYSLVDQDTISGTDAGESVAAPVPANERPQIIQAHKDALEKLKQSFPRELVESFINSKEPPKVIPAFTDLDRKRFARDADIEAGFRHGGGWKEFYKRYPGANGIEHFSLPVFDKEHRHALIYHTASNSGMAGGGELLLMEKSDAGWRVVKSEELWVS